MKDYTVVISYTNGGEVCEYLYVGECSTMLEAIGNGMLSFQEFMKERKMPVEILEVNAWIHHDPVEDCLKELEDDEYYQVMRHVCFYHNAKTKSASEYGTTLEDKEL